MALSQSGVETAAKEDFCPESRGSGVRAVASRPALFTANLPAHKAWAGAGAVCCENAFPQVPRNAQWPYFC